MVQAISWPPHTAPQVLSGFSGFLSLPRTRVSDVHRAILEQSALCQSFSLDDVHERNGAFHKRSLFPVREETNK